MQPRLFGVSLGWVPMAAAPAWLLLTALMGFAAWLTLRHGGSSGFADARLIVGFILICWLHPLYTAAAERQGVRRIVELGGSAVTLVFGLLLTVRLLLASATVAALFLPVLLWLAVATYYLYMMLRFESAGS